MMVAERTAWVASNFDKTRTSEEGQHWAEVVAKPGEDDEEVLYATTWHTSPHPAINEAEAWMRANGVVYTDD